MPQRPFAALAASLPERSALRQAITAARRAPEPECVPPLLPLAELEPAQERSAAELAKRLVAGLRGRAMGVARENMVQGLLQEFSLSSEEGVALMCMAEALLRIPDAATRDALIRDKIGGGDWQAHLGQSTSAFVNAATWGLLVTGKLVATHEETGLSSAVTRLTAKFGEPLIRKAVDLAMRLMGRQFVAGETIAEALENAKRFELQGFRYSYDMLGEAAVTARDAERYYASYENAIHAIGAAADARGVHAGPGISIKLSALHPRYSYAQRERVLAELYPRLKKLADLARHYDIGINIDAEEADRLDVSLDLLERLCHESSLDRWNGIGFVVQGYQKRCPYVIDYVIDLARRTSRRAMVRLVKGAYWDSEIKRAQVDGLDGYPVYTRKSHTDVSYLACARKLLAAPDAVYPQFATHNAQTLAAIYHMAGEYRPGQYEFQCLHGMGESLYMQVVGPVAEGKLGRPCRIYAPVGTHETLLAYLVRRLLENGANTSFINRIADPRVSLDELVASPVETVRRIAAEEGTLGLPHPKIPLPRALFGALRPNSMGMDLSDESDLARLADALAAAARTPWRSHPAGSTAERGQPVVNPADRSDVVGEVVDASEADVERALEAAAGAAARWQGTAPAERAARLEQAADLMEARMTLLMGLIVREAGKTFSNAISEVREAVDFLRYYARQARSRLTNEHHRALGPVACISPWNFPLAIFTGQVGAALAAGNPVLAKPAEQTPLIAAEAVRILHAAGVPEDVVQLVPGAGETVGAKLVGDARVHGVVFTGSTDVARVIQRSLAKRAGLGGRGVALIAETGGQNAMIVDSSALTEQVVADACVSAFDSAGQRCSALRVLCLQEEIADRVIEMLEGAMAELAMGVPDRLAVDVGPVIDEAARKMLEQHIETMRSRGHRVYSPSPLGEGRGEGDLRGTFVSPTLIHIDRLAELEREVFGPVLHVLRFGRGDLDRLIDGINALGYGLTLGIHSRVDETIEAIVRRARVGNIYVNRNIVGAVVGVQPFGGEGLSGTGPKAGGPLYLYRLLSACPPDAALEELRAIEEAGVSAALDSRGAMLAPFEALRGWARSERRDSLASWCDRLAALSPASVAVVLPGPTGERNSYAVLPREAVLCLAAEERDRLCELAVVLAIGSRAVWPASADAKALAGRLPAAARAAIDLVADWRSREARFDAVLHHAPRDELREVAAQLSLREGPIVNVHGFAPGEEGAPFERLLIERVVSVNTAAAGGNASLMSIG